MPALSKKQQKFMGIVRSIQKGEQPASKFDKDARDAAKDMKKSSVKKFASTKHKGLPMKKEVLGKLKELIKQELSEYTYGVGDVVKDDNPTCPHYGAQGKVKSVNPKSVVFVVMNKGDNFEPGQELEKSHDQMKKIGESLNEMSAKSKKIISKLGKKEKEMFMDMVDMMGFDQVMADYKRDKKAFKQALKDMSENINEGLSKVSTGKEFNNGVLTAIELIVKQANNLKGPLSKHPMKRNVRKIKAVENIFKKFIKPEIDKQSGSFEGVNLTSLKKYLADGKFKAAIEYDLLPAIKPNSFRGNSFYFLDDKVLKLLKKLSDQVNAMVNQLDKAQLENINENKVFKVGDTISLLSFDRRHRGKAKVKSVSKSRANKFGIKNHYTTNKGTFTDMEVEGTEAYKLRFKGNTEKQVTKAMQSPYGVILPESINEDGHTDVASSKRKVMIMVQDSNKLLNKLNGMNKEDSLPSWWTDKITLSQNYLQKATDYITNPVESVNEDVYIGYYKNKKVKVTAKSSKEAQKQIAKKLNVPKRDYDIASIQNLTKTKQNKHKFESMNPSAVKKMRDEFEKTGQLPPHLKKFALDLKILKKKHKVKNIVVPGLEWMSDMKEQSVNENRDFEKLYNLFTKKDYFNLKNSIKTMLRNWETALKKGDKGAQKYKKQDIIKAVTIQNKANAKRVYDELVTAIKKKDIRRLKSRLRYNQPYSIAIFNQTTGKKLPKNTRDIQSFLDNEFMKESVNEGKGVEKVLKMANDHSFGKLGGRTVDALSAGLFKGVYDKASQNAKDKINKMNEKQLYVFMTKLWSKFGNQVRIG